MIRTDLHQLVDELPAEAVDRVAALKGGDEAAPRVDDFWQLRAACADELLTV